MTNLDVDLTAYAYGGDAIGRLPDGRAVFVPFAIPGERVRIELLEEKRGYARARLLEVLRPSDERVTPRCIHFGECGGCDYQHMPYELQLTAKQSIVRDQLQRIAGISDPPVLPVIPSPSHFYYRNTVQFHQNEDGRLGFNRHEGKSVFAIRECHLPEPALNTIWPQLDFEPVPGLERIGLRLGAGEDVLVTLEGDAFELPELELDAPFSVVHLSPVGPLVLAGDDHTVLQVLGRPFKVSAGSFFQVNTAQAEAMVQYLLKTLPLTAQTVLLDVYCGVGLFSAFLAPKVERLIGIELSESAVDDFAVNLNEFENVDLYLGAAEDVLPGLKVKADGVVVDPPRAGLDRRALDALVEMRPAWIAYVSCDLATLSRDARRLLAVGYHLEQVQPFDLFPQTGHIETIALLSRGKE